MARQKLNKLMLTSDKNEDWVRIRDILAEHPEGMSIVQLSEALGWQSQKTYKYMKYAYTSSKKLYCIGCYVAYRRQHCKSMLVYTLIENKDFIKPIEPASNLQVIRVFDFGENPTATHIEETCRRINHEMVTCNLQCKMEIIKYVTEHPGCEWKNIKHLFEPYGELAYRSLCYLGAFVKVKRTKLYINEEKKVY